MKKRSTFNVQHSTLNGSGSDVAGLLLIQRVPLLEPNRVQALVDETEELVRIFGASLRTATGRKAEKHGPNVQRLTLNVQR